MLSGFFRVVSFASSVTSFYRTVDHGLPEVAVFIERRALHHRCYSAKSSGNYRNLADDYDEVLISHFLHELMLSGLYQGVLFGCPPLPQVFTAQ